jgi:hypothetical protein
LREWRGHERAALASVLSKHPLVAAVIERHADRPGELGCSRSEAAIEPRHLAFDQPHDPWLDIARIGVGDNHGVSGQSRFAIAGLEVRERTQEQGD